jgi:hypothetical protein
VAQVDLPQRYLLVGRVGMDVFPHTFDVGELRHHDPKQYCAV